MQRAAAVFVGLSTLDIVYRVPVAPAPDRKVVASTQVLAAGGPAANAAVTFAALSRAAPAVGERGLGGGVVAGAAAGATLVTALGRHPLAGQVAADLASRCVTVLDATPELTGPPAVSSAWVVEGSGERAVVSVNAGGVDAPPPAVLAEVVGAAAVLLVDGHHPRLAVAAASAARAVGRLVLLDAGSWKPVLDELLPLVDVAVCSADFRLPWFGSADESVAELSRRYGVPAVAVTAGPAPIRWWLAEPGGGGPAAGEVAPPRPEVRDTLGAGDAFHGALAWALAVAGRPGSRPDPAELVAALRFAAAVASLRCETFGPRGWLADPRLTDLAAAWVAGP